MNASVVGAYWQKANWSLLGVVGMVLLAPIVLAAFIVPVRVILSVYRGRPRRRRPRILTSYCCCRPPPVQRLRQQPW